MCGVPVSEALSEHKTLALPHTYVIGPAPEAYKSAMQSAAKLREKLRAERTNLVPKMIETWDEVPLVLQLMDGSKRRLLTVVRVTLRSPHSVHIFTTLTPRRMRMAARMVLLPVSEVDLMRCAFVRLLGVIPRRYRDQLAHHEISTPRRKWPKPSKLLSEGRIGTGIPIRDAFGLCRIHCRLEALEAIYF